MQIWPLVIRPRILYSKIFTKSNIFHLRATVGIPSRGSRHDIGQRRFCLFSGHKNSSYAATFSPISSPSFKGWMRGKSRCILSVQGNNNCNWFHRVWVLNENRCCAYRCGVDFKHCAISSLAQIFNEETCPSILLQTRSPPFSFPSRFFHVKEISIEYTAVLSLVNVHLHLSAC